MSATTILIAEDEEMLVELIAHKFQKEGFEIILASNGVEALSALKINQPDVFITDIHMSPPTGLELITIVRDELKWDIPIIILSGDTGESQILEALSKGANDYVTKPFRPDELYIRVKRLLARR